MKIFNIGLSIVSYLAAVLSYFSGLDWEIYGFFCLFSLGFAILWGQK